MKNECIICNPNIVKPGSEDIFNSMVCFNHYMELDLWKNSYKELKDQKIPDELLNKIEKLTQAVEKFVELNIEIRDENKRIINPMRGRMTKKMKAEILRRDNWTCQNCGIEPAHFNSNDSMHVDHIKPIALGGTNDESNLQVLCATCNLHKAAHDFESIKRQRSPKDKHKLKGESK